MADVSKKSVESILVVDDNPDVLCLVVSILETANFNILQSTGGAQAIQLAVEYPGKIDLLLSDVQMPGMSGPELGLALKESRPDLRIMLMSGGVDGSLLVLNYGWAFIAKPFLIKTLLALVNDVLHTPDRSQGIDHYDTRKDIENPSRPEGA